MTHPRESHIPLSAKLKENSHRDMKILEFQSILQRQKSTIKDLLVRQANQSSPLLKKEAILTERNLNVSPEQVRNTRRHSQMPLLHQKVRPDGNLNMRELYPPEILDRIAQIKQIDSQQAKQLEYLKSDQYRKYLEKLTEGISTGKDIVKEMKQARNHNVYLKKSENGLQNDKIKQTCDRSPRANRQFTGDRPDKLTVQERLAKIALGNRDHRTIRTERVDYDFINNQAENKIEKAFLRDKSSQRGDPMTTQRNSLGYLQQKLQELEAQQTHYQHQRTQRVEKKRTCEISTQTTQKVEFSQKIKTEEKNNQDLNDSFIFQQKRQQKIKQKYQKRRRQEIKHSAPQFYEIQKHYNDKIDKTKTKHKERYFQHPQMKYQKHLDYEHHTKTHKKQTGRLRQQYQNCQKKNMNKNQFGIYNYKLNNEEKENNNEKRYKQYDSFSSDEEDRYDLKEINIYSVDFKLSCPAKKKNLANAASYVPVSNKNYGAPYVPSARKWQETSQASSVLTKSTDEYKDIHKSPNKLKANVKISLITPSRHGHR